MPEPREKEKQLSQAVLTTVIAFRVSALDAALLKAEAARHGYTDVNPYVRALALSGRAAPDEKTMVLEAVLRLENTMVELIKLAADEKQAESIRSRSEAISAQLVERFLRRRSEAKR